jgi:hypothetical protein
VAAPALLVRNVTRLVDVERELARARRSLEPSGEDPPGDVTRGLPRDAGARSPRG